MSKELVSIVIPVYKAIPDANEVISLDQCVKILFKYQISFIAPVGLDTSWYETFCLGKVAVCVERFDNSYFEGIKGYNQLLLSSSFYERFLKYRYALIYQLDAFVFKDELSEWCRKGYDYVGAPWLEADWQTNSFYKVTQLTLNAKSRISRKVYKYYLKLRGFSKPNNFKVGNGGLSLRKVDRFYILSQRFVNVIQYWSDNEDIFWSMYAPLNTFFFRIPSMRKAAQFSFDSNPQLCYELIGGLPFGCHAWHKDDPVYPHNMAFWKHYIHKLHPDAS